MSEQFEIKALLSCTEDQAYEIADILVDGLSEHAAAVTIAKAN